MRSPSCEMKTDLKKGSWSHEEDEMLKAYIQRYGIWNWSHMPKFAGLKRSGKSCRLRWMNYLKPNVKRGNFSQEEEETILHFHSLLGNRWSAIASKLPGRSDNEVKNYWHTHLKKRPIKNLGSKRTEKDDMSVSSFNCETNEVEKLQDNHENLRFGSLFLQPSEDDSSSSSCSTTSKVSSFICEINEVEKLQDNHENLRFGSLLLQSSEDDSSSSSCSTTSKDYDVEFNDDYYDLCSPGTFKDVQSFWKQICPLENLELGTSHQDISFGSAFSYSFEDATSLYNFYDNNYENIKH